MLNSIRSSIAYAVDTAADAVVFGAVGALTTVGINEGAKAFKVTNLFSYPLPLSIKTSGAFCALFFVIDEAAKAIFGKYLYTFNPNRASTHFVRQGISVLGAAALLNELPVDWGLGVIDYKMAAVVGVASLVAYNLFQQFLSPYFIIHRPAAGARV